MVTSAIQQSVLLFFSPSILLLSHLQLHLYPPSLFSVIQQLILLIPYFAPVNTNTSLHHPSDFSTTQLPQSKCCSSVQCFLFSVYPVSSQSAALSASFSFLSINTNKYPSGRLGSAQHPQYFFSIHATLTHNSLHKPDLWCAANSSLQRSSANFQLYRWECVSGRREDRRFMAEPQVLWMISGYISWMRSMFLWGAQW